jgi:hypothetical protein
MILFTRSVYIGVDLSGGKYAVAYAAIDENLHLLALGQGNVEEALAFIGGQHQAVVALNAPPRPSQGCLAEPAGRSGLEMDVSSGQIEEMRLAEYLLRERELRVYKTPARAKECRAWVRLGFDLYGKLAALGYQLYPASGAELQVLEAIPQVCFTVWLERQPFSKSGLEGRLQRQLVLYAAGLDIPDPMDFFEEITRYRILQGILPADVPYTPAELNALANAYAAWLAGNRPDEVSLVGDPGEGQVLVPAKQMQAHYRLPDEA